MVLRRFSVGVVADPAVSLTRFIGRASAIEDVCDLVDHRRLVTLTGSGGCGKTRLAIEVARQVGSNFDDGVPVVELAPVDNGTLVASELASATGVSEAGGVPVLTLVCNRLADRNMLIVLDNCEHLVDACAEVVAELLKDCPGVRVLATSRTPLGVEGEVTWRVPSLSLPSFGTSDAVAEIEASESGQLLLDRARLALPGFAIDGDVADDVIAICRRLDGLPLAIELAASRLRALSARDLSEGLEYRFSLLSGSRLAPPRQRTLKASIEWSYDLLDDRSRALLRRLSVFSGPFALDVVERVCTDELAPTPEVRRLLAELVDHSLVHLEDGPAPGYRLLESVRAYARARLAESGEESDYRDRHLDYVRSVSAWYDSVADGEGIEGAHRAVEPILAEVRSALEWAITSGRIDDGLTVAAELRMLWLDRDRNQEGRDWLNRLVQADLNHGRAGVSVARTRAQLATAHLCLFANDPITQEELSRQALDAATELGDRSLQSSALVHLGWAQIITDPDSARDVLQQGIDLGHEIDDLPGVEFGSLALGTRALLTGDLRTARRVLATAVDIGRSRGSLGLIYGVPALGYVDALSGRPNSAVVAMNEYAARYEFMRVPGRNLEATMAVMPLVILGRWDDARERLRAIIEHARSVGNPPFYAQFHLAMVDHVLADHQACRNGVHQLQGLLEIPGFAWLRTQASTWLGDTAAAAGDIDAAALHLNEAMTVAAGTDNALGMCTAQLGLARLARRAGSTADASRHTRIALGCALDAEYRIGVVDALETFATLPGPDQGVLLACVEAERARTGYARFPIDEPAFEAAVDSLGDIPERSSVSLEQAIGLAMCGRSTDQRPSSGWASLTPAEMRVAELVAEGLTNPEVGERLFISRRTVQAHLSHIYGKLGISNRAELAAGFARNSATG